MNFNLNLISDFNLDLLKRVIESKNISEINAINTSSYGQLYQSIFSFEETMKMTASWYKSFYGDENIDMLDFSFDQIKIYEKKAKKLGLQWSN